MKMFVLFAVITSTGLLAAAGGGSVLIDRGWLGVVTENLSPAVKIALQIEHGVVVSSVVDSGPADVHGIRVGDVIMTVDGERIDAVGDLRHAVRSRPNQTVEVQLLRGGRRQRLRVRLGTRQDAGHSFPEGEQFELEDMRQLRGMLPKGHPKLVFGCNGLEAEIDSLRAQLEALRRELEQLRVQLRSQNRGN